MIVRYSTAAGGGDGVGITTANADLRYQAIDADLDDLADGELTGSKVGTGIDAGNISSGTLDEARLPGNIEVSGTVTANKLVGNSLA